MNRLKIRSLGLSLIVLGLMAFGTTAAHAEPGARWLLAEKNMGTNLIAFLEAEVEVEKDTTLVLHTEILKVKVLFLCTELKMVGAPKLIANGGISAGKVLFSGCTTDLNGTESPECVPTDKTDGKGRIVTNSLTGLLVLHQLINPEGVDDLLRVSPEGGAGGAYATIEMGASCPVGMKVPIFGLIHMQDCEGKALMHLVKHLIQTFTPLSELWAISHTAEHTATLLGSAWGFLKGEEHAGVKFSGDPA